jgi:hypothetical protein
MAYWTARLILTVHSMMTGLGILTVLWMETELEQVIQLAFGSSMAQVSWLVIEMELERDWWFPLGDSTVQTIPKEIYFRLATNLD